MPESEVKTHRHGSPSILHEFASNIVDGRNVVGIEGMPDTKGVCQEGRAAENRLFVERKNCHIQAPMLGAAKRP